MYSLVVENLSYLLVIAVYHTENVESQSPFERNVDILTAELPAVWHISLGADVTFISIIKVDETVFFLLYEFLQLLGLIRIELRRGFTLRTFSYTSISRAKADKKALKVSRSLLSLKPATMPLSLFSRSICLLYDFAYCFFVRAIHDWLPTSARTCLQTLDTFGLKVFYPGIDKIWVILVWIPICSEVRPVDFRSTAR